MTRTGLSPKLAQHRREPLIEVHPGDAAAACLVDGGLARVVTRSGSATFRVAVTNAQVLGTVFVPMHWSDAMASGGRGNLLPDQSVDPISGQPGFKNIAARVEPLVTDWQAFLLCEDALPLAGMAWWCRSRVEGGWLYELAGMGAIDVEALLPPGERIEAVDFSRGMRRVAVRDGHGRLIAALHLTRSGILRPRDWLVSQLGKAEARAVELLAARAANSKSDRGPVVCVCHGVGRNQIEEACCAGAVTLEALGAATLAGTNCGSCRPAISALLRQRSGETTEVGV